MYELSTPRFADSYCFREISDIALLRSKECKAIYAGKGRQTTAEASSLSVTSSSSKAVKRKSANVEAPLPAKRPRVTFAPRTSVIRSALPESESDSDSDVEFLGPVKVEVKPPRLPSASSSSSSAAGLSPIRQEAQAGPSYLSQRVEENKTMNPLAKLPFKVAEAFKARGVTDAHSFERLNLQKECIATVLQKMKVKDGLSDMEIDLAQDVLERGINEL